MVDFKQILINERAKGKFLGYCESCDTLGRIYTIDILPAYQELPMVDQRCKCPKCGYYQNVKDLIPF